MNKSKKTVLIVLGVVFSLVLLVILFISPITKYLIEKYDVTYIGREITLDWAYVNPFTGYVHLSNLEIHEKDSAVVFFKTKGLSVNMAMLKLIGGTYEISEATLDEPLGYVKQHNKQFNFSDLIEKFSSKDEPKKVSTEPTKFNLLDVKIINGEFHYDEDVTPISYFIKNVNIESAGLRYDVDTLPIKFGFSSGIGTGEISGDFSINLKSLHYSLGVIIKQFDLEIINQYLKDLTNYGTFAAILDADMKSSGNFKSVDSITNSGNIALSDFHFGKTRDEDFASFEKLVIAINKVSPRTKIYDFDSISLKKPFFRFEKYDSLDNIQNMFGVDGNNVSAVNANQNKFNLVIEIAKLIQQISKNLLTSYYKVGRMAIYDGDIQYNDYTLSEKFAIGINPLNLRADSINKSKDRISVQVNSGIKPHGNFDLQFSVNPRDSSYFDLDYHFRKIPITAFNPFITTYTSFPLDRGAIEIVGKWSVKDGNINSKNHLILLDPRVSTKVKNKDNSWIPVPLAMALVRERGNVIDYEVPITGNLKDPKFNFWDVIIDVLKNIVVKPVTTPYRMEVKYVERKIEKSMSMKWDMQKSDLTKTQIRFINQISNFLKDNKEAIINVTPKNYSIKEKEFVLLFEAKKKYYLNSKGKKESSFSSDDSVEVAKMSIKDANFLKFLDNQVKDKLLFSVQQKAVVMIKPELVDARYNALNKARIIKFLSYFEEEKVQNQVKINKSVSEIPFNGFSYYDIEFKGEIPDFIQDAFEKMEELDNSKPREKYKLRRKKNQTAVN